MADASCHVCGAATDDACNVCERPTCAEHFWDQEYLGLCEVCQREIAERAEQHGGLQAWPYPIRKPRPGMYKPGGRFDPDA